MKSMVGRWKRGRLDVLPDSGLEFESYNASPMAVCGRQVDGDSLGCLRPLVRWHGVLIEKISLR